MLRKVLTNNHLLLNNTVVSFSRTLHINIYPKKPKLNAPFFLAPEPNFSLFILVILVIYSHLTQLWNEMWFYCLNLTIWYKRAFFFMIYNNHHYRKKELNKKHVKTCSRVKWWMIKIFRNSNWLRLHPSKKEGQDVF